MAQKFSPGMKGSVARERVRTPGKYIVLILFVPVSVVAVISGLWLGYQERRALYEAVEYRSSISGERQAYYALPPFLVDLDQDADGRTAYLRLKASIKLGEGKLTSSISHIESLKPALNERLAFFLRELRPEDFAGSEGMARVKREMLRRVNIVLAPQEASDVIIEDIIIQ